MLSARSQKVATIISSDKIKTQAYCDIQKLAEQVAEANEKKDVGRVNELFEKIETLEKSYRSRICRIDRWGSGHREEPEDDLSISECLRRVS
jgi:hypothetical protein